MAEPTSTAAGGVSLIIILTSVLGPLLGPYAVIVMASLLGAMWPLSVMPDTTRISGAFFLARVISTAVVLTASAAWYLEAKFGFPAVHGMAVVAFFIGALGNGWAPVFYALRQGLAAVARGIGGAAAGKDQS